MLAILESMKDSWGYIEPLVWLFGAIAGLVYWIRVRVARRRRYANRGGEQFVLALQVGRPVAEAVKAFFGELDVLVTVETVTGKSVLETDRDYRLVASELYRAMAANQNRPIKLVLSGPVGLSFLVGQLVGLAKFDVEVFQFDPVTKGYQPLPTPDRHWL